MPQIVVKVQNIQYLNIIGTTSDFVSFTNHRQITSLKFSHSKTFGRIETSIPPNKLNLQIVNTLELKVSFLIELINTVDDHNIELINMTRVIKLEEYLDAFADMEIYRAQGNTFELIHKRKYLKIIKKKRQSTN